MTPPKISRLGTVTFIATTEGRTASTTETKSGMTGKVSLLVVGGGLKDGSMGDGVEEGKGVGVEFN
jgi:hypothetical protein